MEDGTSSVQPMVPCRGVGKGFRDADGRSEQSVSDAGFNHRSHPSAGRERKRRAKDQALGRSRGDLTTKTLCWPMRWAARCASLSRLVRLATSPRRRPCSRVRKGRSSLPTKPMTAMRYVPSSLRWVQKPSLLATRPARLSSRTMPSPTGYAIVSSGASTASSTSDASLPDMIDAPSISSASFTSPQP